MFLASVMDTNFSILAGLKMDQDLGGSEFMSFYCLTISPTGNSYKTKIVKLEQFNKKLY